MNWAVPCSARAVRDGFGAKVAWQCIGAGERSQEMKAESALEPLAGRVISRDTSVFVSAANQCENSEVSSSV